jgi:oligoendopeptidase F
LSSKTHKRFEEWFKKVNSKLEKNDRSSLNELPSDCKYLKYWAEKLRKEEPEIFSQKENAWMHLHSQVGQRLAEDFQKYLKK